MSWLQLEAGTSASIFEDTQTDLPYLQDGWIPGIRRFLKTVDTEIHFVHLEKPQLYRQDDIYIMDLFRHHGLSTHKLQRLNRCRLYLQVARLSDITDIAGLYLYAHVPGLDRPPTTSFPLTPTSKLQWPRQPRPGPKTCKLWSQQIHLLLLEADGRLRHPLGKWTHPYEARDRCYPTLFHPHTQTVHQLQNRKYQRLPNANVTRRHIHAIFDEASPTITHPPGYPVDASTISGRQLTAHYTPRNTLVRQTRSKRHHRRFGSLPEWQHDLLQQADVYDEHLSLLASGDAIVVTDGGEADGKGYFGVTIAVDRTVIARSRSAARGDPRTMSSFRAAAYGFLAGILLLTHLLPLERDTKLSIHTDSASLLARLQTATTHAPVGF